VRVPLHHTQCLPTAQPLDRSQVYPSGDKTGSEGVAERVPRYPVEAVCLVLSARSPGRDLGGVHGPHEVTGDRAVGPTGDKLLRVAWTCPLRREVQEGAPSCAVDRHPAAVAVLREPHGEDRRQQVHVVPAKPRLF
jgi:hypothetical protein